MVVLALGLHTCVLLKSEAYIMIKVKQDNMGVKEDFNDFSTILSEEEIVELAKEYGVEDKRKRKLPVVLFFG